MAETQVLGWGTQAAPAQRVTKDNEVLTLLAVDATFDGTAAAGSWVPALQIVSDAGVEVGTFPLADSLAAGDSARITFAPFLGRGSGSGTGFLHWGTNTDTTNLGLTLTGHGAFTTTTGGNSYSVDTTNAGISFSTAAPGTFSVAAHNSDWQLTTNNVQLGTSGSTQLNIGAVNLAASVSGGMTFQATAGGDISSLASSGHIYLDAGVAVNIRSAGGSPLLVVTA